MYRVESGQRGRPGAAVVTLHHQHAQQVDRAIEALLRPALPRPRLRQQPRDPRHREHPEQRQRGAQPDLQREVAAEQATHDRQVIALGIEAWRGRRSRRGTIIHHHDHAIR
ncbi:hypothetical protein [Nannocystis pusilla]|uniref:hypothetical protein n=1 Tax=Nannocystis pusilla TaxID=889268 RepID=UPI0021E1052D|nr:hypothetical protein [Nannocystis pusilla]